MPVLSDGFPKDDMPAPSPQGLVGVLGNGTGVDVTERPRACRPTMLADPPTRQRQCRQPTIHAAQIMGQQTIANRGYRARKRCHDLSRRLLWNLTRCDPNTRQMLLPSTSPLAMGD